MRDKYKVNAIDEFLETMRKDEYALTRMKGDYGRKTINIDEDALKLLRRYYNGELDETMWQDKSRV